MLAFNDEQPYITVVALSEKDGKFLMVREGRGTSAGRWNFPAGRWDSEELLLDAVERECKEESGYGFRPKFIVGLYSIFKIRPNKTKTLLRIVFAGEVRGDSKLPTDDEISEIGWFTVDEILSMDDTEIRTLDNKTVIQDYLSGKKYPLDLISHTAQKLK